MFDMLEELGMDGEEGLQHLEQDLKECDAPTQASKVKADFGSTRRFSGASALAQHHSHSFSTEHEIFPRPNDANFSHASHNRRPSQGDLHRMPSEDHRRPSIDHLKDQINQINEQLRVEYERKEPQRHM
eukprot:788068-Rhodomonas_salina.1